MDTNAGVRKLVELIFGKKPTIPGEIAAHSSIPSDMLNEDFPKRLTNFRQYRHLDKWKYYFDSNIRNMLLSHKDYVTHALSACVCENTCNENIFDSFIRVCVLLSYLSEDTLSKVGVDFRELNTNIFMVFYRKALKSPFRKRKDFNRLMEYLRDNKHLKWSNDSTASTSEVRRLEKLSEELDSYEASLSKKESHNTAPATVAKIPSLVREVLSTTSAKLPDLPTEYVTIQRLVAYKKREKANEAERKKKVETNWTLETSHGDASLNSDSKTGFRKHEENIAWHESIIEAVIRHNLSKDSGKEITNSQSHEEANVILEHLENKIKSLIEVLDNCSEE